MPNCKTSDLEQTSTPSFIDKDFVALKAAPTRRDFIKTMGDALSFVGSRTALTGSLASLPSICAHATDARSAPQDSFSEMSSSAIASSKMDGAISVHIPLWHQGGLNPDKFWNEVFQDLSAHKIHNCFLLNYYFVDPVMGTISKQSQFNNNQAPDLAFLARGMQVAQDRGIKASLYPVLEIDNPHQIGGIWRGNLNFFGRTLETFFQQYLKLIDDILDISLQQKSPYIFIGSELASLSHNIAARPFWEELIYRTKKKKQQKNGSHELLLIYAAHWEEYLSFPFWRHMDEIGINAYFPLSSVREAQDIGAPSQAIIQQKLDQKLAELQKFSIQHNRPIYLTEFGLTSFNKSTATPWGTSKDALLDFVEQANGYKALLASLKREQLKFRENNKDPWLTGTSFWHWKLPYRHGSDYNIRPFGDLGRLIKDAVSN
ncbi:MAG: hypothetical protein DHS20C07_01250 [Methyloligella sp.]|nr:MAG: hypothetical protein DHS20C07_01250 [Methyloligella sp.]